jgi:putative serine protease PepD
LVDFDCETGVAVLKVDQVGNLPALAFGDSNGLRLGQNVVAVGGSLSDRRSVTRGVVSALHRTATVNNPAGSGESQLANVIQTDAGIDTSMSGGPLLNTGGQVVGVMMAGVNHSQPVAFALAAADLQPEIEQILQTGQLIVPSLGVQVVDVTSDEAALKGGPVGGRVSIIASGGPAERSGLKTGDVIVQLDDQRLDDAHPLSQVLRSRFKPDQKITVTYVRGGSTSQLQLTLRGEHPACP